jgi:hypothetical protein
MREANEAVMKAKTGVYSTDQDLIKQNTRTIIFAGDSNYRPD